MLLFGLLLGMKHATDADHLAAMATLSSGQNSLAQTIRQGVAWGVGHTLTLMLIGGIALWLGAAIPPKTAQALEFAVGLMLMMLGVDVWRRLAKQQIHVHVHSHDQNLKHVHAHSHLGPQTSECSAHSHGHPDKPPLRALFIGMMHGLAGSAALIALSLGVESSWFMGLLYIAIFGIGSIVGMALLSAVITVPLGWSARSPGWLHEGLPLGIGGFSCLLGVFVVYRIGVVEGLLFN